MGQPLGSQYVLHDLLGRGAMGQVFRGSVRESGRPVAVKVLKPELVSDPEVVARFFRERLILTSVSHPNVAKVLDLVIEGETIGIVMELVDGQDLRRYLRQRGTLAPAEVVSLTCQLLQGLAAVHAADIVHRDVKPENVLLSLAPGPNGLKLTDFGVSRLSRGSSLTKMSSLIGTPEYMAPELADHDRATPAADLYSTGIVMYEMLAGRTPFAGGHPVAVLRRQLEQPPPPIPGVPDELWAQIAGLLEKSPGSRPESATAVLQQLSQLQPRLAGLRPLPPLGAVTADREWSGPAAAHGETHQPAIAGAWAVSGARAETGSTSPETILRHRDHGSAPDDPTGTAHHRAAGERTGSAAFIAPAARTGFADSSAPAARTGLADSTGAAALTGSAVPAGQRSRPPRPRIRPWLATVALAVIVAVLGTVLVWQDAHSWWGKPAAVRAQPTVSYTFPVQRYPSGLVVARRWTLGGQHGSQLTETVTATSATGKALTAWFQDSIPATIATTVQTLRFTSGPVKVVHPDPVVEWYLRLPAHGSVTVGYLATVEPGGTTTTARLAGWAKGLDALEQRLNAPTVRRQKPVATPTPTPTAPVEPAYTPPAQTPTPSPTPSPVNPNPYPTYTCDPSVVTCSSSGLGF